MDLNVKRVITPCGPLTNIRGEISSDLDRTKKMMENLNIIQTRSSWLNCALRDDEAVYRVSMGHYEAVAVGNDTGSVEDIHAFIYCTKWRFGQVLPMPSL